MLFFKRYKSALIKTSVQHQNCSPPLRGGDKGEGEICNNQTNPLTPTLSHEGRGSFFLVVQRFFLNVAILIMSLVLLSSCCLVGHKKSAEKEEKVYMEVTGYCSCGICCKYYRSCWSCWTVPLYKEGPNAGKKKDIGITSDGTKATKGTIAADVSLYPYGTKMYVPGYGWGEVHDTGSSIKGDHIDVFFDAHDEAMAWGRQKLWVTIVRP